MALGAGGLLAVGTRRVAAHQSGTQGSSPREARRSRHDGADREVTLFLCGDVMLGRGIDQIQRQTSRPVLHEAFVRDARRYVDLAERASGPIPREVAPDYVWGEALREWRRRRPHARIVNLETSLTRHDRPWPKGIHYRMHPGNAAVLTAAGIDACVLANNHVLDWGREGLDETLATLRSARIAVAGAGQDIAAARAPATLPLPGLRRLRVFAAATGDSGVPESWAAGEARSGVYRLPDLSGATVARIAEEVRRSRRAGDTVVFSVHWGGNWGYAIASAQRDFAHALIDEAGVDLIHGHSSHHPRAIEIHRGRPILYGCGDFLNDYEGIEGHEAFRGELGFMYFPRIDAANGRLRALELVPTRIRRFRIERAPEPDRAWLLQVMRRECGRMGCGLEEAEGGAFALTW